MLKKLHDPWFAQKAAASLLLAGLGLLLIEVRFEHQVVLAKKWQSWIPLVYSGSMVGLGMAAIPFWQKWGRMALISGFLVGVIVGLLGFWFHSKSNPVKALSTVLHVVLSNPGKVLLDVDGPPVLAPLAVVGLTLVGAIICTPVKKETV